MIAVLIAADDPEFWSSITNILETHFSPVFACRHRLALGSETPSMVVCDTEGFSQIECERVILVYRDALPLDATLQGARQVVAVADSQNDEVLAEVASTGYAAIACGLRSKDTLTLSSMDEDSAVINIQRTIPCLDGTEVEPQEIPVRLSRPTDSFVLMAAAAICVLSGNIHVLENGKM